VAALALRGSGWLAPPAAPAFSGGGASGVVPVPCPFALACTVGSRTLARFRSVPAPAPAPASQLAVTFVFVLGDDASEGFDHSLNRRRGGSYCGGGDPRLGRRLANSSRLVWT
jgi:hypothetical protein